MSDVIAELMGQVVEMEVELIDMRRLDVVRELRANADRHDHVTITLTAPGARLLAADLEELSMLRMVPPTGEAG
jgi:metal-sulfur cluster biosynthetic enzyme